MQKIKLSATLWLSSALCFRQFPIRVFPECPVADSALFECEHSKHSAITINSLKTLNTSILPKVAHILTNPKHKNTIACNYGSRNREKKVHA
jgi:hypothetical protein